MSDQSELDQLREAVADLLHQFSYPIVTKDGPAFSTGGLSALEMGFKVLGWTDPHQVPELKCDEPGCLDHAVSGVPTEAGYRRLCTDHFVKICRPPTTSK